MEEALNRVYRMREGGNVLRSHCIPHQDQYTVGKHVFDMLVLLEVLHPDPSLALFKAILRHDLTERWTGDLPGSVKDFDSRLRDAMIDTSTLIEEDVLGEDEIALNASDWTWLHALDALEFYMWTLDQLAMGNRNAGTSRVNVLKGMTDMVLPQEVSDFFKKLRETGWRRTNELERK